MHNFQQTQGLQAASSSPKRRVKTSYQLSYSGSVSDTHNPTEGTVEAIEALLPGDLKKEQIKAG